MAGHAIIFNQKVTKTSTRRCNNFQVEGNENFEETRKHENFDPKA